MNPEPEIRTLERWSPHDGKPVTPVRCTPLETLPALVEKTKQAAALHARLSLHKRAQMLKTFSDAILDRGERLTKTLAEECGKLEAEAWMVDILGAADLAAYWSQEGPELLRSKEIILQDSIYRGKQAFVERLPRGVIALITPWNFPVAIPLRSLFPALLAGNGVILKPSEYANETGSILVEAANEVFGPDLVQLVCGGAEESLALVRAGVDAVVFVGGQTAGRKVAETAAERLIPVSLELGGKDAAIVLEDAALERTARGLVWAAFANAGQNCAAIERVYALPNIAHILSDRIHALVTELVVGREVGPMCRTEGLERNLSAINEAEALGAQIRSGGNRVERAGLWLEPTLICAAPHAARLLQEETFGPVLPVIEITSVDEAIKAINSHPLALTASVWTQNVALGEQIARQLEVGVVTINNHSLTAAIPALPWSGVRQSGYGVTNSPFALDVLTHPKLIFVDTSKKKRELWWFPYTPGLIKMARALSILRNRRTSLWQKLRALPQLVFGLVTRWKVE